MIRTLASPMHGDSTRGAFGATHHIDNAVSIQVDEHGVLGSILFTYRYPGPMISDQSGPGVQIDSNFTGLFPTDGEIQQSVSVNVSGAHTICTMA